ncbi:MAG: GIY-YIG nuclease family protein [Bacteroidia bacterium]|nr:GIY-YIG nuclease family protein [Bacteroidia bacterium]
MEYVVYVLYSVSRQITYTGLTQDLRSRYLSHQIKGTKGWTLRYRPWVVVHVEFFASRGW